MTTAEATAKVLLVSVAVGTLIHNGSGTTSVCEDTSKTKDCNFWKKEGFCNNSSQWSNYMTVQCMKTCGFCGRACTSYSNGKTEGCEDKTPFCSLGSSSHCQRASKWYNYMATNCRRRCGLCGASNGNNSDCRGTCPRTRKNPARYCEDACNPSDGCQGNKKCVCDGNCGYSCVPNGLSCSRLPRFQNGRKSVIGGRSFNASIRYRCNKPYTLLGSATRTCRGIGRWDGKRARCKIICDKPRDIPFGNKRMDGRRKGNNVTYWCFPGYTLNGAATITCGRNAKWNRDPPCCVRKETYYRDSGIHTNHTGGLDLVFVFDGSNSVSGKEFKKGLNFAVTLVDMLGATWKPGETQVAAVTYGTDAELVFNLGDDEFNTANEVKKKIREIHQPRGGTATRLALDMVRKVVAPNTRSLAQKVLFFITDGKYNIGGKLEEAAKTLRKKKKFEIYAIVVGKKPKLCELMYIASQPYEEHILDVKNQDIEGCY